MYENIIETTTMTSKQKTFMLGMCCSYKDCTKKELLLLLETEIYEKQELILDVKKECKKYKTMPKKFTKFIEKLR